MKISVIGAGAMGGAMVEGFVMCGMLAASDITVSAPHEATLERFKSLGVNVTTDNKAAIVAGDVVFVVVKPWLAEQVIGEIRPAIDYSRQTIVSVMAGVSGSQLKEWLGGTDGKLPRLFIVIPNIAIAVKSSMTFIVPVNADEEATAAMAALFDSTGLQMVTEERLLGAVTTLASCGIAYAMRYVRASTEGGVELGFKAHDAQRIVMQTMKGAVDLLQANGSHPEVEIDKVTTPGGMTIRGLNEMEHAGFTSSVIRGLKAGMSK